ncbi:MAG TPA: cupin domain-containing protein [Anaerolineae bacterium]|nr:cupin domain-containing protein [Anaerolineae bacterium]
MNKDKIKFFFHASDLESEIIEGNVERVIYSGEHLQAIEYHFPPNKHFPAHKHEKNEQMGYLISGKMGFIVGGEKKIINPGDYYHAPMGVEHSAWTLDEPAVLLDFFAPPREDLIR